MLKTLIKTLLCLFFLATATLTAEELVFWNFWDPKFILPVIEQFEKEHPGVKIRNEQITWGNGLDKIIVSMANGRAPDICELGSTWMAKFMVEGAILDVTDQFRDLQPDYLMWAPATFNGRLFGMPWLTGTRVMFYNRQLFARAGLDPDKPPVTWQELLGAARLLHDPAHGVYGFGMNAGEGHILYKKFMPFAWGNNARILDDRGAFVFTGRETREALEFYLRLKQFSYCEKQDLLDEAFKQGKLGLSVSGSWNFARYPIDAPGLDFGVALMPKPSQTSGFSTSFLGGEILVLFRGCRNPDLAAKFIRFLTSVENTMPITREAMMSFPAHKDAYADPFFRDNKKLSVFVEQMKTAVHPPVDPLWIDLEKIINTAVEKAMYGVTIDEAFAEANVAFERLSKRQRRAPSIGVADAAAGAGSVSIANFSIFILSLLAIAGLLIAMVLAFLLAGYGQRNDEVTAGGRTGTIYRSQQTLLFLSPWLLTFVVFWLYPLLFSLVLSFCDYDVFHPAVFSFSGFKNYARLLTDSDFLRSFVNTLFFVACTTPVTTLLALTLALMISNVKRGSQVFRSVFFLPSIVSIVVTATIFKSIYAPVGMLNRFVAVLGIPAQAWLVEKGLALPAIMFMNIWAFAGYYMVLYLAALKAVPQQLYEAAEVDGASAWQKFWYITLPQIHYMTIFILIVNTIRSWQVFPEIFTLTRGGPVGSTNTLVHYLYETAFRYHDMGYSSAISYVLLAIIMIFSLLQMRILQGRKK